MIEVQVYKGVNFRKHKGRRYFECGQGAARRLGSSALHRVIWMDEKGPIPKGMHIHHKNHDPSDNRIENLELLSNGDHIRYHFWQRVEAGDDPLAYLRKWQSSEKSKAVLRENMEKCRKRMPFRQVVCGKCSKPFITNHPRQKFCSEECYGVAGREGNKLKQCEICGAEIKVKSHSTRETRTCGYTCGWALRRLKANKPQGENIYASQ